MEDAEVIEDWDVEACQAWQTMDAEEENADRLSETSVASSARRYRRTRSPSFQGRRATPARTAPSRTLASTSGEGSLVQRVRKVALHLQDVSGRRGGSRPPLAERFRHARERGGPLAGSRPSLAESVRNAGKRSSPGSRPSLAESVRNVGKLNRPGARPVLAERVRNAGKQVNPVGSAPARQTSPEWSKRQPSNGREPARGPRVVLLPKAKVKPGRLAVPSGKEGAEASQKKAISEAILRASEALRKLAEIETGSKRASCAASRSRSRHARPVRLRSRNECR
ncbi:RMR3 [Symbiodinium sp. CCMP2592]|nr:RMR3 [Symbiodinium sp. CCMP2592]